MVYAVSASLQVFEFCRTAHPDGPFTLVREAAKMYSHEQPSFHIWASFISSSTHETLLFFGFNGVWCILECSAASRLISNALGSIGK